MGSSANAWCSGIRWCSWLPGALPYEVYRRKQAEQAVEVSRRVIELARGALSDK